MQATLQGTWPLKTIDAFKKGGGLMLSKCVCLKRSSHRRWLLIKSWQNKPRSCQSAWAPAVHLCGRPEGGGKYKEKQKIYKYIFPYPASLFYWLFSLSFQRLGDREVPREVKERPTCRLERQRASKGRGEKIERDETWQRQRSHRKVSLSCQSQQKSR